MSRVICMASAKGGSGKTLLTTSFGTFLTAIGKTVLLLDTDAATNGLSLLHLKELTVRADRAIARGERPRGVYENISPGTPASIVELPNGVHLIPATYAFENTENTTPEEYKNSLQEILQNARSTYDFVFLDSQAGSDIFAQIAMSRGISDEVVIVSEYDPISAAGVERLKGLQREHLTYERTWVLLNKILPEFAASFSDFLEVAKYLSPIPWDADVVRAYARRRLALDFETGNEHTLAVLQTLRGLLSDEVEESLSNWLSTRAAVLRQPLSEQYEDAEKMLHTLVRQRIDLETALRSKETRQRWIERIVLLLPLALAVLAPSVIDGMQIRLSSLKERVLVVGSLLIGALSAAVMAWWVFRSRPNTEFEAKVESQLASVERRRKLLEDELQNLEILLTAEAEDLFGKRSERLMRHRRSTRDGRG